MIPLKLTLRGFLTYRDEETLDFEQVRTAVIIGENGHGKSALFDAITYALFGKHRGGSQPRYLVNQECRELAVRFEFQGPDGRRYRVDRSLTLSVRRNGVPAPSATAFVFDGVEWKAEANGATEVTDWVQEVLGGMTYEICCQSILLRQGEHDRFLSAKPTERQLVLNTLLDLEPYRQLQKGAQGRKRQASASAAVVEGRLAGLVRHDEETREQLRHALVESEGLLQVAEHELAAARDRLTATVRYWELDERLKEAEQELGTKRALLEQSAQVRAAASRRATLEQSIPLLGAALQAQDAAREAERAVEIARAGLTKLDVEARRQALRDAEAGATDAEAAYAAARLRSEALSAERTELMPKAELLVRADGERAVADARRHEAKPLAADTAADPAAQTEAARLGERKAALPWLRQIAADKHSLVELEGTVDDRARRLAVEEAALPGNEQVVETARQAAAASAVDKRQADVALVQARHTVSSLEQELHQRHEASDEQICSHCGQPIDAAHVAEEIRLLDERLAGAMAVTARSEQAVAKAEAEEAAALSSLALAETDLRSRCDHIAALQREIERANLDREAANARLTGALHELTDVESARTTSEAFYPTDADLQQTERDASAFEAARLRAERTRAAATNHAQLLRLAHGADAEADRLESEVPAVERRQVRERWAAIEGETRDAEQVRQRSEGAWRQADGLRSLAERALRGDEQAVSRLEAEIQVKHGLVASHRATAIGFLRTVPEELRQARLTHEALTALSEESASLKPLADRLDELASAPEDAARIDGQRRTLLDDMAEVPDVDRRDPDEAKADRRLADVAVNERRRTQQAAKTSLDRALADAEKAKDLQQDLLVARTREGDAHLLDTLLGVQQLQGRLVEAARVGITDAANRELDAISRGALRIEMQRKVKRNGEEAELELMVLDRSSVREPIDAAYLSGSQRFRVAVALALGIGQYVGGAARGQRAVIIDEGFGSLDTDGIDAMAEHLRDLSGRLDRVILVTHQQAMKKHFDDGFVVQRKDGTSRIKPGRAQHRTSMVSARSTDSIEPGERSRRA